MDERKIDYCKVTQDLLPMYIDRVLSEDSLSLVEEHLKHCDACGKIYRQLLGNEKIKDAGSVMAPVSSIKRKIIAWTISGTTAIAALIFICAVFAGIHIAWPLWSDFQVADEQQLEIKTVAEGYQITPASMTRSRILYCIYDFNEDDSLTVYLSFGTERQQYHNMVNHGFLVKDVEWKMEPLGVVKSGNEMSVSGGHITLQGSGGFDEGFTDSKTILFPKEVSEIYYVPDLEKETVNAFYDYLNKQIYAEMDGNNSCKEGTIYIATEGFDFSNLGELIPLQP